MPFVIFPSTTIPTWRDPESTDISAPSKKIKLAWGKQWPPPNDAGNYSGTSGRRRSATLPVGSFKSNSIGLYDLGGNDWEGLADYDEASRRLSEFAGHFKAPTNNQISEVLAKLDAESPDWDKTQPERFYASLAALFPETKRRPVVRASKSGCLVLLLILAALVSILVTIAAQ